MALMNDIIGKYQREASQRIAEARGNSSNGADKVDLLDSIIISKGCGTHIPRQDPSLGKGSIFKAVPTKAINSDVKRFNQSGGFESQSNSQPYQATSQKSALGDTIIYSPGQSTESFSGDVFKELARLKNENQKLLEEIKGLRSGE